MMINLHSTNNTDPGVDFKTAVLRGQALDKGLYVLNTIPRFSKEEIDNFQNLSLDEIGFIVMSKIIGDLIPENDLKKILKNSLNFLVPLEEIEDRNYICYLDKGPTASFKDFGARTLARLMEYFLIEDNSKIIILTATSGDTGGAVAHAFYEMKGIKVVILFPRNEVSNLQRKQMTTLGKNVIAIGIEGKFDDCQQYVKSAFNDPDLRNKNLSSANSINFGRLLPQCLYYFLSYSRIFNEKNESVIYCVPSGNFGNLMGGLIAAKMGLPVKKFIAAVNENDEFPRYLTTGTYTKVEPSRKCISNAMNVGHPSNLARVIDLYGGQMNESGTIIKKPDLQAIRRDIASYSITDDLTRITIKDFFNNYKKFIEPHGAVGWASLQLFRETFSEFRKHKAICFETADPAKFPDEFTSLINKNPQIPPSLSLLNSKKEYLTQGEINNYQGFKKFLENNL
ncbi:MAG: threonine synthase [Promethearchaeota archaeon]|jgi:threonine synthase